MNEELRHHGILGQKWGIRRFQNSDGSLTSAGKRRYDNDSHGKSGKDTKSEILEKSRAGTKNLKRTAAVGATIAVASLAIIGASRLSKVKSKADVGRQVVNTVMNATNSNVGRSVANTTRTAVNAAANRPKMNRQDAKRMKELMDMSRAIANQRIAQYGNHYFG